MSIAKVQEFLQTLPPPDVVIKRWRSSTGANKTHESQLLQCPPISVDNTATWSKNTPLGGSTRKTRQLSDSDAESVDSGLSDGGSDVDDEADFDDLSQCRYLRLHSTTYGKDVW